MTCEECGTSFEPVYKNKNAKYCRVCQVLTRVTFMQGREDECWACDEAFVPLSSRQKICGRCRPYTSKHSVAGVCAICDQDRKDLLGQDVRVCTACANDPAKQRIIVKALVRKQAS